MRDDLIYSVYRNATSVPNAVVMTAETESHFYHWLERMVPRRDQWNVEQDILALLRDDPSLVETHSWPEMERMAQRQRLRRACDASYLEAYKR